MQFRSQEHRGAKGLLEAVPPVSSPRAHTFMRRCWEMSPGLGQTPLVNKCELLEGPRKSQGQGQHREYWWRSPKTSTRSWLGACALVHQKKMMCSMPASLSALCSYEKLTVYVLTPSVECTRIPTQKHFTAYGQRFKTKQKL